MRRWFQRTIKAVSRWGFTVILVPKRGGVRRLTIPWLGIIVCALIFFFLGFSFVYLPLSQLDIQKLRATNSRLREENERVKPALQKTHQMEELFNEYARTVESINSTYGSIRRKAPTRLTSRGGTSHTDVFRLPAPVISPVDGEVSLLETLEANTQSLRNEVARRLTEAEALHSALVAYERELDHTPSIWPVRGRTSSRFGYRSDPFTSIRTLHRGMDLACKTGTPVRAAADGVVSLSGTCNGYGLTVKINHGYGYETLYAHNSALLVKVGQAVKKGQIIARVGSTGRSTSSHLHYEVRVNDKPVNPSGYLW